MKTINKDELIEFVLKNDFAYVYGAGIMAANEDEARKYVANVISQDGKMINIVDDLDMEGCGSKELASEKEDGCSIYKVWNYNEEPMYIAYYE